MKTADHFWTDPSADELVQRHRIHGGHCRQDSPTKRPALCVSTGRTNGRSSGLLCQRSLAQNSSREKQDVQLRWQSFRMHITSPHAQI